MNANPAPARKESRPSLLAQLRSGAWLDRDRVIAYGRILLVLEIVALAIVAAGTYGLLGPLDTPTSTDFLSFFSAGTLADQGHPALIYDQPSHRLAEQTVFGDPNLPYSYWFFYPPTFVTYCAAMALVPYLPAFFLWIAATGTVYVLALRAILRDWPVLIAILSFPSALITAGIGQNSFLTTAIFGTATYLIERRPLAAGAILGGLCYKPHFLLMTPVALIAGRHWRALAAMAASVAAFTGLSLLLFGWQTWEAFLLLTRTTTSTFETGKVGFAGLISLFGAVRLMGGPVILAYGVQALAAVAAGVLTAVVWRKNLSLPVRAMTLIAATLFSVHVILFYDLLPMTVAIAWLLQDARKTGFLPWERTVLMAIWLIPMVSRSAGLAANIPLGPLATGGLLLFVALRARQEHRARTGVSPATGPNAY
ncbi:MAG TPA: glycosyltransferase family 87 protein [Aliidongia sp.]|uniref:glycosyltransferase family 87 protein n=1 Tax=Aliidongia sp. TaxID=1914230 RepID=UPI002DDCC3FD|nr:glycosyltransferase family 87 protein [Aliidongia sp.]HEV2676372.1 glycosyltransferase family 87 protein [Aliidongia sp.]